MSETSRQTAGAPEELTRLFIERANAADLDGLVALYEPDAVLAAGAVAATGHDEIRGFFAKMLERRSEFPMPDTPPPIRNGALALTSARLPNGTISVEIAHRQDDGSWLWAIDQLKIKPLEA